MDCQPCCAHLRAEGASESWNSRHLLGTKVLSRASKSSKLHGRQEGAEEEDDKDDDEEKAAEDDEVEEEEEEDDDEDEEDVDDGDGEKDEAEVEEVDRWSGLSLT